MILFVYCLVAVLACATGAVLGFMRASATGRQIEPLKARVAELKLKADNLEMAYKKLETAQREQRAEYNPVEAVRMSFEVQAAKKDFEDAEAAFTTQTTELDQLSEASRRQMLLIVPLIAIGMLHGIAAPVFYVRR